MVSSNEGEPVIASGDNPDWRDIMSMARRGMK
jgi:hypothetical protein